MCHLGKPFRSEVALLDCKQTQVVFVAAIRPFPLCVSLGPQK